ncbi:MAG TPA: dephospho-CoA kinase [Terriglobia bacterium]|nr:dephospho-CoA kinase [Terriglobia bacterium]
MSVSARYFGLTGGIACGKTAVAALLRDLGAYIIDADKIGHEMLLSTSPAFPELIAAFGRGILDSAGRIDRRKLGPLVFADPEQLQQLNRIVHPRIIERIGRLAAEHCQQHPGAVVVVDAALIYETGIPGRFLKTIVAWCRPEQQVERVIAKSGLSPEDAEKRIASQMPADEKCRRADFVIDCSGGLEETRRQVKDLYPVLQQLVRSE